MSCTRRGPALVAAAFMLLLAMAGPAFATHDTPPGMVRHSTTNDLGTMEYAVYVPEHLEGKVPLFVHLHGGVDSADDAAHHSRLNEIASRRGFVVVYPEQEPSQNAGIWDDARAAREGRTGRQSSLIEQVVREVMADQPIDPKRVSSAASPRVPRWRSRSPRSFPTSSRRCTWRRAIPTARTRSRTRGGRSTR